MAQDKANKDTKQRIELESGEHTDFRGRITLEEVVVATTTGLAARQIEGVYAFGRTRFFSIGDDPRRGVSAEVGRKQAAFDVDVAVEYGYDLREVADNMRSAISSGVDKMAGRETVEININVIDIHLPPGVGEPEETQSGQPRVI